MKRVYLLMSVLLSIGLLTSCSSSDTVETAENTGPHKFQLTLQGAQYSIETKTQAADPSDETKINNVIVGVFNSDGTIDNITMPSLDGSNKTTVTATSSNPDIIVVANVPSTTFAGVTNKTDFLSKTENLSITASTGYNAGTFTAVSETAGTQNVQSALYIPMVGSKSVTAGSNSAVVSLYRMVSRISIKGISTEFDATGAYSGATFVPTEIFMSGAPSTSTFLTPWESGTPAAGTPTVSATLLNGENAPIGATFLTSGTIASALVPYTANHFFYVYPNTVYDGTTIAKNKIRLIIKGTFTPKVGNAVTVYYPIVIGRSQAGTTITGDASGKAGTSALGGVLPNQTYTLTAKIKSEGITDPTKDINPANIDVTVSVASWSNTLTQDVIFN
ncbi:fimbrial protein [Xylanibacter oryzae]|uniref:fimbrial protein n=1 Tax=Xylanibacter oryzae TaxID=185293 RepID=UPI000A046CA2|nr:fimbrial protein [Xylanibacter oryzae]